jgi:hypothetical protein
MERAPRRKVEPMLNPTMPTAQRPLSQVEAQVETGAHFAARIEEKLKSLSERLQPVLSKPETAGLSGGAMTAPPTPILVELAAALAKNNDQFARCEGQLTAILDHLEL